jgi:hypothetical protein
MEQGQLTSRAVRFVVIAGILVLSCISATGGARTPGKYSGVVFFDRWDTCELISGAFVMYVSEDLKSGLRSYAGQAVQIDATKVSQPINPGDGLIQKYNWVGPAPEPKTIVLSGLELLATADSAHDSSTIIIKVHNIGTHAVDVYRGEMGINVFSNRPKSAFSAADGRSEAVITRQHPTRRSGQWEWIENGKKLPASYEADRDIPDIIHLEPGASYRVTFTFSVPPGEYQFVFGYGGGVHAEKSMLSKAVSFDVSTQSAKTVP